MDKVLGITAWVFGIILAKGFVSTTVAVFLPLWAWYLTIEYFAKYFGIL